MDHIIYFRTMLWQWWLGDMLKICCSQLSQNVLFAQHALV